MSNRIRLASVVLGFGTTVAAFFVVFPLLGVPLFPILFVEGLVVGTLVWYAHAVLATLPVVASWLLTFFLGGLVAGRSARAYAGLNGAAGAALAMLCVFALIVGPMIQWLWYPAGDIGDQRVRSENLGLLGLWVSSLCAAGPFAVLGGFLGGKAGGRLRARSAARAVR